MMHPWTSKPKVVDLVQHLFDMSVKIVETPGDLDSADRSAKDVPLRQLPELATVVFATMTERLEWLSRYVEVERDVTWIT
jgi:nuclear pore complex protein Nup133